MRQAKIITGRAKVAATWAGVKSLVEGENRLLAAMAKMLPKLFTRLLQHRQEKAIKFLTQTVDIKKLMGYTAYTKKIAPYNYGTLQGN